MFNLKSKLKDLLLKEIFVYEGVNKLFINKRYYIPQLNEDMIELKDSMEAYHYLIKYPERKIRFIKTKGKKGTLEASINSYFDGIKKRIIPESELNG